MTEKLPIPHRSEKSTDVVLRLKKWVGNKDLPVLLS
ncbi:Uncharacterised protein [Vibrio cholerae]|nr:hypothetical protein VCD_003729 [Vibrio cholerae MJ-1236]ACQ61900.1 hypothetical protein VCD_003744 [Vibrio cholerae MJ-1236]EEO18764.1 hypothetical protein VCE_000656 [Vibrio cholerae B33]EEO18827.1 hypothetical protein VCE_000537 [Vibrio cholerae B33]CSI57514.1 Uncharacterised protein [Vibrio cholerae]